MSSWRSGREWPDGRGSPRSPRIQLPKAPRFRRWFSLTVGGILAVPAYFLVILSLWMPILMPLGFISLFGVAYAVARASDNSRPLLRSIVSVACGVVMGTAAALALRSFLEAWPVAVAAALATAFSVALKGSSGLASRALFVLVASAPATALWEIHDDKVTIYLCFIPLLLAMWEELQVLIKGKRSDGPMSDRLGATSPP